MERLSQTPTRPLLVLLAMVTGLAGCPRPVVEPGAELRAVSPLDPGPLATRLGLGDLFEVRVYQEPDLTGVYRVGPEGSVDFPFCGRLEALGLTSSEVATKLTTCLQKGYLRAPQVTVTARDFTSKKVLVYGYVTKPGAFAFVDGMSVVEAIVLAGGFAQFAAQNAASVIRTNGAVDEKFKVPIQDIGLGRAANFYLRPGDIVFVPESWN